MIVTSNREPKEWLPLLSDRLLAEAVVDGFGNNAFDLVLDGTSYRTRQKPGIEPYPRPRGRPPSTAPAASSASANTPTAASSRLPLRAPSAAWTTPPCGATYPPDEARHGNSKIIT